MNHLVTTLDEGIALKRRIIEDLRPSSLNNLGLKAALEILCTEFASAANSRSTPRSRSCRWTTPASSPSTAWCRRR